jgi:acetyl esterase/lipase
MRLVCLLLLLAATLSSNRQASAAETGKAIPLWPHGAPGEKSATGPEADTTKSGDGQVAGKPVIRLGNVSAPTITFFPAPAAKNTGATVVVFPGGGYRILAMDLEGTEVCAWLNSIGVNAVLLKYRVPEAADVPKYQAPLQDAQRALGITRQHATEWNIDPQHVGVLGFSAGGNLAAVISNNFEHRAYAPVDQADELSCRPDFAVLIYPAYLVVSPDSGQLAPEVKPSAHTPPTFLAQTEDDPVHVENSLFYYLALKRAHVPAEMHLYSKGGHGYGLRQTEMKVTSWPARAEEWLRSLGELGKQ